MFSPAGHLTSRSGEGVHDELVASLRGRREEIEEAILTRAFAISNPDDAENLDYAIGLRAAVPTAIDYGLRALQSSAELVGPAPVALLAQARNAARSGVRLDIVIRRYTAGYSILGDFLQQELRLRERSASAPAPYLLQQQLTALFDRLIVLVSDEYQCEAERLVSSPAARLTDRVKRLLAGELVNSGEFDYNFDAWHLGVAASGPDSEQVIRTLTAETDRRLLLVQGGENILWGWLGGRLRLDSERASEAVLGEAAPDTVLVVGEPAPGLQGWRFTHRQAQAALAVARRSGHRFTRYVDVAMLAAAMRDDTFVRTLRDTYLVPLASEPDGGEALRATLRAFFAAGHNASSAAAAIGIGRQTVTRRLHTAEDRIGRPLAQCAPELEVALRLNDLSQGCRR